LKYEGDLVSRCLFCDEPSSFIGLVCALGTVGLGEVMRMKMRMVLWALFFSLLSEMSMEVFKSQAFFFLPDRWRVDTELVLVV
jgi:hypothetical protein